MQAYFPVYRIPYVISNDGGLTWTKGSEVSVGFYSGVMLGSQSLIDNMSIGIAYSHRCDFGGLLIGVGYVFDPSVKTLSDELVDGQSAPIGTTQVHYKNESSNAIQVMLCFTAGW